MKPTFFASAELFRAWLDENSATATHLVVGFWKVDSGRPSMSWSQSVDEALCFGWIDGVRKRIDDLSYQIRFTPRKQGSIWSAVNIEKFEKLRAAGKITAAGEIAYSHRTDERSVVYAYEQPAVAELTAEELRKFKKRRAAWEFFNSCPPGYRKVLLHWITTAKKSETREQRLTKLIDASAAGERLR
jgi:uncharacterized protein YdeI (YjbR/CyaY-like superfamily)